MKSWWNKVPLFFGFYAYLTLFWVPAFATLANLEMHFFQKDLVKPIWKLAKFNLPLPKHQFKSIKPQVPGLRPWCHVWWRVLRLLTPPTLNTNNSFCVLSWAPWDERIIFMFSGCKCVYTFNCLVINPVFSRIFIYFPPYCAWTLKTPNFNHRLRILWLITEGLEYIFIDRKFVRV